MGRDINKNYWHKSWEDADMMVGYVNQDNVRSAFKVRASSSTVDPPHYFQMDRTGETEKVGRKGGTIFRGPGTFQLIHGDSVPEGIFGVVIDSGNGDMWLRSDGTITIEAENVNIIAKGSGNGKGNVQINANEKLIGSGKEVVLESSVSTKLASDKTVEVIATGLINMFGGTIEAIEGASMTKGSKTSLPGPWTFKELEYIARFFRL